MIASLFPVGIEPLPVQGGEVGLKATDAGGSEAILYFTAEIQRELIQQLRATADEMERQLVVTRG